MHASTRASLTSSILSWAISMYSPSAATCAVATISMSEATGIVSDTSRGLAPSDPGRTDSGRDIRASRSLPESHQAKDWPLSENSAARGGAVLPGESRSEGETPVHGETRRRGSSSRLETQEELERSDRRRRNRAAALQQNAQEQLARQEDPEEKCAGGNRSGGGRQRE